MLLTGKNLDDFWTVRTAKRIFHHVRNLPPGSLLFLLFKIWLCPLGFLIAGCALYIYVMEKFRFTEEQYAITHMATSALIVLGISLFFKNILNWAERLFKFWDRIGEPGQFFLIIMTYAFACLLAHSIIKSDFYSGHHGDDFTDIFLYPSVILYFILGYFITCLRIFIDILKSRNF